MEAAWPHLPPFMAQKSLPIGPGTRREKSIKMPKDTVNSELYTKTLRGHSGILMDPWSSSTWRKAWRSTHTPNKVTKGKLDRYARQKTHRDISLHKTLSRYRQQTRRACWSPRPNDAKFGHYDHQVCNPRAFGLIARPSHENTPKATRQEYLNQVRAEATQQNPRKRARETSQDGLSEEAPLVVSSDKEEHEDPTETTSPMSPPDHERGHKVLTYQPKSPQYPHQVKEVTVMSTAACQALKLPEIACHPSPKGRKIQTMTHKVQPLQMLTKTDHFQDKDRQKELTSKLSEELSKAPWQHDPTAQAISEAERISTL